MVIVVNISRARLGSKKHVSFGMAGTGKTENRVHPTQPRLGVERSRGREIGPHSSGQEIIGNASPGGVKWKTARPSPAQASPPSDGCESSRKRGRHQGITSVASKQAVLRELATEAVTVPEIDEEKPAVMRYSSLDTEVQLSM